MPSSLQIDGKFILPHYTATKVRYVLSEVSVKITVGCNVYTAVVMDSSTFRHITPSTEILEEHDASIFRV
jgi:hypothetical protein